MSNTEHEDSFWDSSEMSEEEANTLMEQSDTPPEQDESQAFQAAASSYEDSSEDSQLDHDLLNNARLRLEQGRLYEMLLKHNLFDGIECEPRATANVQREIRSFIKERLEILVGLKPDPRMSPKTLPTQALPFNDLEIDLLKKVLSKMTKGATAEYEPPAPQAPKQQGLRPMTVPKQVQLSPVSRGNVTVNPNKPKPAPQKQAPQDTSKPLEKSPYEMTMKELMEHNKKVKARQSKGKAISTSSKKLRAPDADQMIAHYSQGSGAQPTGMIGAVLQKMHGSNLTRIENVGGSAQENTGDDRI